MKIQTSEIDAPKCHEYLQIPEFSYHSDSEDLMQ